MRPELQQQRDFLFEVYFGGRAEFGRFISGAYRDWSRTFRGIGTIDPDNKKRNREKKRTILTGAKACLARAFRRLRDTPVPDMPDDVRSTFDRWHDDSCNALVAYYGQALRDLCEVRMTYGQAQKWLNMTMKYCWLFGGQDLDWLNTWYPVAHVPVDEVVLRAAKKEDVVVERPCRVWSRWDDRIGYHEFQRQLRQEASKLRISPLELEFEWWNKYRLPTKGDGEE